MTSRGEAGAVYRRHLKPVFFVKRYFISCPVHGVCFLSRILTLSGFIARGLLSEELGGVHLSCFHIIGLQDPFSSY
ncbi:hypothetical protein KOW79_013949 [Hemibagrus wyckioides]|uniref:Uncharacterized protein n=1 Tax=Hemibagrus wyckioides TaxID=337641 RepID=A0A9D3NJW3_9TELE|nr:hypothetical protein KOW79_013949 [Hemibagrus wyckioides]